MRHRSRVLSPCALMTAFLAIALASSLGACSSGTDTPGAATPAPLAVSAASSLKAVMTDLGAAFDAANGTRTTFNFEASGTLQTQVEAGAPADVFASAATKQVRALEDQGLVDAASTTVFASNEIVLVVPADSTLGITGFEDLAKADVRRITYGDPAAAPHGAAAEEILDSLGLAGQVKAKVIYAANVTQTLEYVISGEVDAGIVFSTEAAVAGDKVRVVATSEPEWHGVIAYPAAVVSSSTNKELAQAFIAFLAGAEGQSILQQYGFLPAQSE